MARAAERPTWGINFSHASPSAYEGVFVNVTRLFSDWEATNPRTRLTLTEQGIPLQEATASSSLNSYSGGIYKLRYEGTGKITFSGLGKLVPGSVRKDGKFTRADVQMDDPLLDHEDPLTMSISDVDAKDPVRNLRLIAPGYPADTDRVVRDEFIRRVRPFSAIRFMWWATAWGSRMERWDSRRKPDYFCQTGGGHSPRGPIAWELPIDICSEAGKDYWCNIPPSANDNFIRQLARLIRDRLDPKQKCIVELGNEFWNGISWVLSDLCERMHGEREMFYYEAVAPRLARVSEIFREEWAQAKGPAPKLEIVLAVNTAGHFSDQALQYYRDNNIDYKDVIDGISGYGYFYGNLKHKYSTDEYDKMIDDHLDMTWEHDKMHATATAAKQLGLKHYVYEGGQHLFLGRVSNEFRDNAGPPKWREMVAHLLDEDEEIDGVFDLFSIIVHREPRMGQAYRKFCKMWQKDGGDLFMHYTFAGGCWGLLPNLRSPGCVKWDAVMAHLLPAGDATLDGKVDMEDFEVIERHFGREGTWWWEQGDFNADNRVDREDFLLLYGSFEPTGGQRPDRLCQFAQSRDIALPDRPVKAPTVGASDKEVGFVPIFNGKDLSGWEGQEGLWSMRNTGDWATGASITSPPGATP